MDEHFMKTGYTTRLRSLIYEKVLEYLGYSVRNLRQTNDDELLRNVLAKSPEKIITDAQMERSQFSDYLVRHYNKYGEYHTVCRARDRNSAIDQCLQSNPDNSIYKVYKEVS